MDLTSGVTTIKFADDEGIHSTEKDEEGLTFRVNKSLERINKWIKQNYLMLPPNKKRSNSK